MTIGIDILKRHIGLFGLLAAMAIAPIAHANYVITFSVNGGAVQPCLNNGDSTNSTGTVACSGSGAGLSITNLTGSSNSPGTPSLADEFSSSGSLSSFNSPGTAPVTVTIWYLSQNFVQPVTGGGVTEIDYASNSSGTSVNDTTGISTVGLQSCVDEGGGGTGASFCLAGTRAAALTNPTLTYPVGLGGSINNSVHSGFAPLTAPYSLEQQITIVLGGGDSVNYSMSQALTPVPEPMSVGLLGGVLLLTGRALHRRRKQQNSISSYGRYRL